MRVFGEFEGWMGKMGGDACAYDGYVVFNGNGGLLYHNPKSLYTQIPLL